MPAHGEINPNDPNFYWDANFGKWTLNPGSPTGGANISLAQALSGYGQTQGSQNLLSQTLGAGQNDPLSPPGGGGLASTYDASGGGVAPPGQMYQQPQSFPTPSGAYLRLEKDGQAYLKNDLGEIGQLLQQGYQVRDGNDPNGQLYTPKSFQGGYLLKSGNYWVPVDTLLSGNMTDAQRQALVQGGYQIDPGVTITGAYNPGGATGGTGTTAGTGGTATGGGFSPGNTNAQSLQLSGNLEDMLKQLMQESLNQGKSGQDALSGLIDELKKNVTFNQGQTEKAGAGRDSLVSALLGGSFNDQGQFTANDQGLLGGYNKIIGNIGTGLDPLTMAALQQQAIEGPERDYQGQVQQLKTQLAQRGAYGGGQEPGDFGAIIGGYSPLMTARDTTREGLLQQNAFANQAQKNTNLSAGLSALGGLGTTLGTAGSLYNPNAFANTTTNSLQNALSGINASNATGLAGLNQAGNFAGALNDAQGTSLSSLLKSAAVSSIFSALNTALNRPSNPGSNNPDNTGFLPDFNINIGNQPKSTTGGNWWDDLINSH